MIVNGIIIENREFDAFTGNLPPGWEKFLAEYPEVAGMVRKKVGRIMAGDLSSEDGESKWPRIELDVSKMNRREFEWRVWMGPIFLPECMPRGLTFEQERLFAKIFQWLSYPSDPIINKPDISKKPKGPRGPFDLKKLSIPQVDESLLLRFGSERRLIMRHPW